MSLHARALLLLSFLVLAALPVSAKEPSLSDSYTITYKDKSNPSLQPVIGSDSIILSDPTAVGTLKIKKKKGLTSYPKIAVISTEGDLTQVLCEGRVGVIHATGFLGSLTLKKAYAESVLAQEIGTVKMADLARTRSTGGGELFETSLYAFPANTMALSAAAAVSTQTLSARKLKVNLSGVSLGSCIAPWQEAQIKLASKSWKNAAKVKDVSLAAALRSSSSNDPEPALARRDEAGNSIVAGHLSLLSVTGGGYDLVNYGSICPEDIYCYGRANKPSQIVGKGVLFTFSTPPVPSLKARAAQSSYPEFFNGTVYVGMIQSGAPKLNIQAIYGDVRSNSAIAVSGGIGKITASAKRLVSQSSGQKQVSLIGGYYVVPLLQTGIGSMTTLQAAAPDSNDIGLIQADLGVNWDLTWEMVNGNWVPTMVSHANFEIRAGLNDLKKIGTIRSWKTDSPQLTDAIRQVGGPFICGQGYADAQAPLKGGVSDGFFTWHLPG